MKKNKSMLIVAIIALVIMLIGSSYAYFAVNFQKNEEENNTNLNTELLSDTVLISNVEDSAGSFLAADIYPGNKEVASIKVNVTGKKDSKIGIKFIYDVEENGLGDNVKISVYKSNKKIETNENYFNCVKKVDTTIEPTKYYEVCEEKDLELLIGEKVLTGGKEKLDVVTDTIYVNDENQAEEYYYYAVVEFLNKETSQNEVMNKVLKGTIQVEAAPPERKMFEESVIAYGRLGNNIADSMLYSSYLDTENLMYDETADNNLRYVGTSPNNYVLFNDELWRIIGVMNNVEDADGNKDSRIKLIRDESIGNYSWDTSPSNINNGYGINEWSQADAMKLMNPGYESESIGGSLYWNKEKGACYNNSNNATIACDFTHVGLSNKAKYMIEKVLWHTGGNNVINKWKEYTPLHFYEMERSDSISKNCSGSITCNDNVIRKTFWIGNIGLIYPSDYGYTANKNNQQISCSTLVMSNWESCNNNSWLNHDYLFMLSTDVELNYSNRVFGIYAHSLYGGLTASLNLLELFPSLYLKSNIQIIDGLGTKENPYILEMSETNE